MGLKDYRAWKKKQELLQMLGLTEEQLAFLPKAIELVKQMTEEQPAEEPAAAGTMRTAPAVNEKVTPEQYVEMFKGDIEEFYPDGRNRN